ncbi:Gfo/Idh/MocA family oxidoreductase [uncultured Prochlorococcus sp.]|uniref:Gfo/Idh/MocA family oxidoreductase n=1 Tax=uncultured Prochlorococcus sp. TaxID=159733 RepID=UPI002589CBB6|nr:Gfo/Idh/MocA family oxidoreductase [uncultured Prochlorococcus sp.]
MINKFKTNNSWEEIIIVGYGNHAKTKIIPAIQKTCSGKISILTNKEIDTKNFLKYTSLYESFKGNLNKLFVLTNPPSMHYFFCNEILTNGFDVFVEKPAFLRKNEFKNLTCLAKSKNLIIYEMLMYLENQTVRKAIKIINSKKEDVHSIFASFTIPSYPLNTYRNEKDFANSLITDIGCYPISFINELNYKVQNIKINNYYKSIDKNPLFEIKFNINNIKIDSLVGVTKIYTNFLRIIFKNNNFIEIDPFFYGRSFKKNLNVFSNNEIKKFLKEDDNAFEKIFSMKREVFLLNQESRFKKMNKTISLFEKLEKQWLNIKNNNFS